MNQQTHPRQTVILDRFDLAWTGESAPEIDDFLPDEEDVSKPVRKSLLIELVIIDLEHRWRSRSASDAETAKPFGKAWL